jgi:polygalacturonase
MLFSSVRAEAPASLHMQAFADAWSAACAGGAPTVLVPASYVFLVGPITFTGDSCEPNMVFQVIA